MKECLGNGQSPRGRIHGLLPPHVAEFFSGGAGYVLEEWLAVK